MVIATAIVSSLVSYPAAAEPDPAPIESEPAAPGADPEVTGVEAEARALFESGNALVDSGDLRGAESAYEAALELHPRARIHLNLAAVQMELGKLADAANHFAAYLASSEAAPEKRPQVKSLLKDLDARLAVLEIRTRAEGELALDGARLAAGPGLTTVRCTPGSHTISFHPRSGPPDSRALSVIAGQHLAVEFDAPAPVRTATTNPPTPIRPRPVVSRPNVIESDAGGVARFSLFSRVDIELQGSGAVWVPGVAVRVAPHFGTYVAGLVGGRAGFEPGATFTLERGKFRPSICAGLPTFYEGKLRPGIAGTAGLVSRFSSFEVAARGGISHAFSVPDQFEATVFIVSLSVATDV